MNQSVEGIIYSAKQHGALMNTLMDEYIITNKLKIFTMHYMRYPTLYEYKCKIPMTSLHVSESNYFIDSQFYHRNHNRNNVLVQDFCLFYDIYFLYNYIYKTYFNTTSKWALILEDDITLCPSIINVLLNVMNDTYIYDYEIHNYPRNKTIDCIYLGHGNTGTLLRISFIPKIVQYILDGYIKRSTTLIKQSNWHTSVDWYIVRWGKKIFGDYSFVGNRHNLLFHPPNHVSNSTMGNSYSSSLKCDGINTWRTLGLKLRDLTK
eukprot:443302_1